MESKKHQVDIVQHSQVSATILVDGIPIQDAVRSFELSSQVGQLQEVTLSLIPQGMTYKGEAVIGVTPLTRDLLVRLGWMPPDIREAISDQGEYYTGETLAKVRAALASCIAGMTEENGSQLINAMQNAGILFRERLPAADEPIRKLDRPPFGELCESWSGGYPDGDERCTLARGHAGHCVMA